MNTIYLLSSSASTSASPSSIMALNSSSTAAVIFVTSLFGVYFLVFLYFAFGRHTYMGNLRKTMREALEQNRRLGRHDSDNNGNDNGEGNVEHQRQSESPPVDTAGLTLSDEILEYSTFTERNRYM
jgi:hypothetical protein